MKNKERMTNIEILRIISMFMIILSHFSSHGNFIVDGFSINSIFIQFIQILGKIGVNIFVLISGYFLVKKDTNNVKKLAMLWFQLIFYSVIMNAVFMLFIDKQINYTNIIKSIMPITSKYWWFASTYFIFSLLVPYINKIINNITKKEYKNLLLLLTLIWCVIPTITMQDLECNKLLWFIYLYLISGYIRLYPERINKYNVKNITMLVIVSIVVSVLLIAFMGLIRQDYKVLFGIQKMPTLIISLLMFILFLKLKIKNNIQINKIAKLTFGIYLIHDNYLYRSIIWQDIFKVNHFYKYNIGIFVLYTLLVALTVFSICGLIEAIRNYLETTLCNLIENRKKKVLYEKGNE